MSEPTHAQIAALAEQKFNNDLKHPWRSGLYQFGPEVAVQNWLWAEAKLRQG